MTGYTLLNLSMGLAALILTLALGGTIYQVIASKLDQQKYPPPGRLVDVGGYHLHIHCSGPEGASNGPTVVMDAGIGDCSLSWSLMQSEVAKFARVCIYDRAGLGWSDRAPTARTSQEIVKDLHALLINAGIRGPYVLVGHSFGGLNARLYASQFPEEVAGMVLVDSAHEDHAVRLPLLLGVGLLAAPLGIPRLFSPMVLSSHPVFARDSKYPSAYKAIVVSTKHLNASRREWSDIEESWSQARASIKSLGDRPLVVLTTTQENLTSASREEIESETVRRRLQTDLANRSAEGRLIIVENSGHYIQYERPELVTDAVREVVEAVRRKTSFAALTSAP